MSDWRKWLSYRLVAPLALFLSVMLVATNELGHRAAREVEALRDQSVESRLIVWRARRLVLLMESAQRGYMVTARPEYRAPYDKAMKEADALLASLRALAAEAPAKRALIDQLVEAMQRKISELNEVMRVFESGAHERAVELVRTDIGRDQLERINTLVDQLTAQDDVAYEHSTVMRDRVRLGSRVALYTLVLLCMLMVFAARRWTRERELERVQHLEDLNRERDKLEAEVTQRTGELTDLARHLQTVREDERSRLARELHDELGGLLTAAKLDVARLRKRLPGAAPEVSERIDHLATTLDTGIALKRRIIEDLRPSSLVNLGLQPTLEIQCAEFAKTADIKVEAHIEPLRLTPDRELVIYRFIQEALTNVAKYAKARIVRVRLSRSGALAQVEVEDDGVGFDPAHVRLGAHGLAGMRFRVQSVGGQWGLRSAPGQGTIVQARLPMTDPVVEGLPEQALP
ncbi:MAG TPA: CHASE3 domain-containing protein [Burkholderiaceae bacterium]|nr:CHASE3 domain-containing protein [Burkholderiaceae bacterium]